MPGDLKSGMPATPMQKFGQCYRCSSPLPWLCTQESVLALLHITACWISDTSWSIGTLALQHQSGPMHGDCCTTGRRGTGAAVKRLRRSQGEGMHYSYRLQYSLLEVWLQSMPHGLLKPWGLCRRAGIRWPRMWAAGA